MNHYETLGVPENATVAEIKAAYKKLAMRYHPDRNGGGDVIFKKITAAYRALVKPPVETTPASTRLAELFDMIFNEGMDGDVVQRAKMVLHKAEVMNNTNISKTADNLAKVNKSLGRITTTEEFNVFETLLQRKVVDMTKQLGRLKDEQKLLAKVGVLLESYTDSAPSPRFPSNAPGPGSVFYTTA